MFYFEFFFFLLVLFWWFDEKSVSKKMCISFSEIRFPDNFLYFRSNKIEKQGMIKLSSYSSKSCTLIVLRDSKATFLWVVEDGVSRLRHYKYYL